MPKLRNVRSAAGAVGSAAGAVGAVAVRPVLWPVAVRQWRRTTQPQWWRHRPFLPVPPRDYLRFRQVTQHGRADHPVSRDDVLNYLQWCRQLR